MRVRRAVAVVVERTTIWRQFSLTTEQCSASDVRTTVPWNEIRELERAPVIPHKKLNMIAVSDVVRSAPISVLVDTAIVFSRWKDRRPDLFQSMATRLIASN